MFTECDLVSKKFLPQMNNYDKILKNLIQNPVVIEVLDSYYVDGKPYQLILYSDMSVQEIEIKMNTSHA